MQIKRDSIVVRFPMASQSSSWCSVWSQFTAISLRKIRKTSPQVGKHFGKSLDSKLVTLDIFTQVFSKYLGFSVYPACWAQVSKRHLLYLRTPCYYFLVFSHFQSCLTLSDVFGFNEREHSRRRTNAGVPHLLCGGGGMHGIRGGCCVQSGGIMGGRSP